MKQPRNIRNAAHQHDDFTNGKFNNAPRIAVRRVEYGNAVRGSGGQLHLLRTDAEAANRQQTIGRFQRAGRDAGLGANAKNAHAFESAGKFILCKRITQRFNAISLIPQHLRSISVDVLTQERNHAALWEAWRTRQPVKPQHFVHRARHAISTRHHRLALNILAVGNEFMGRAGVANLRVGDAIANRHNSARKLQRTHYFRLTTWLGYRIGGVIANHGSALPTKLIAVDSLGGNSKFRAHRLHVLAETARHHMNAIRIAAHRGDVLSKRWTQSTLEKLDQRIHMGTFDREHRQTAAKTLINTDRTSHPIARDRLDRLHGADALRIIRKRETRQFIEALNRHDGAVKVEDQLDGLRFGGCARHRGSCCGECEAVVYRSRRALCLRVRVAGQSRRPCRHLLRDPCAPAQATARCNRHQEQSLDPTATQPW